jgi:hypothetical protein
MILHDDIAPVKGVPSSMACLEAKINVWLKRAGSHPEANPQGVQEKMKSNSQSL